MSLQAGDFSGLTSLTTLDMNGIWPSHGAVFLTSLPAGVFDDLTSLKSLHLRNNHLASLSAGVFDKLTLLTNLGLGNNELTSLPAGVFDKLTLLTHLTMDVNALASLPAGVFDKLTSLTSLRLNGNRLTSLPAGALDKLTSLTVLRLSHNRLTSLSAGVFDKLTLLRELTLEDNALTGLPDGVFDKLTSLFQLTLGGNALTSLRQDVFSHTRLTLGAPKIYIPSAPRNVGATNSGRDVTMAWQPPATTARGVTGYKLRWREWGAASFADADAVVVGASARSHAISVLDASTAYELQVAALTNQVDSAKAFATLLAATPIAGNYAAGIRHNTAVVPGGTPGPPKSARATFGNAQLVIAWMAPDDDAGVAVSAYRLRWKPATAGVFAMGDSAMAAAAARMHTIPNLENGVVYDVEVAAENATGIGAYAVAAGDALARTPRTTPNAPKMVEAAPGNRQLAITWDAPDDDGGRAVNAYRLRWKPATETDFAIGDRDIVNKALRMRTIGNLNNGTAYDIEVAAENAIGIGAYAAAAGDAIARTPRTTPNAPQMVEATPGNQQLAITWNAPDHNGGRAVTAYRLRWKPMTETDFAAGGSATTAAAARMHTIENLDSGVIYDVEIAAENAAGIGAYVVAAANVCSRTENVRSRITNDLSRNCSTVTASLLAGMSGTLSLRQHGLTSLQAGDFSGLISLTTLDL
ncbi:MAG: fibronectin type III domain-containing protein, partial [Gammaproteobacteria bacterium]